jgi:3-hydroxy-9,10-secoandrosta-1,3,5(10)-triene-9,17-dione monooxygenase reductase component
MTDPIDPREFRSALGSFATGVTIVTTREDSGRDVGLTANSFNSVSLDPPMVLWSLAKTSGSLEAFNNAAHFAVHILAADQEPLSNRFASKVADKFEGLDLRRNEAGVPLLAGCSTLFQCRTAYRYDGGDHIIFVGEVTAFEHLDKPPLVFHAGRYALARTKAPVTPPLDGEIGETSLGNMITRVFMQLVAPVRRNAEELGLSAPERYMMNVLLAGGVHDLAALNDIIGHTGVRVTPEIGEGLVERGLISHADGPTGDPAYRLTDRGREILIELLASAKAIEADALECLSADEQQLLGDLLNRLVSGLAGKGDDRVPRHLDLLRSSTKGMQPPATAVPAQAPPAR